MIPKNDGNCLCGAWRAIAGSSPDVRTSTLTCTSSAARDGRRSALFLREAGVDKLYFVPRHNRDRLSPCRNASTVRARRRGTRRLLSRSTMRRFSSPPAPQAERKAKAIPARIQGKIVFPPVLLPRTGRLALDPSHRITLSALANTLGGMVNPICLAAFRLITSSNFVGCSTGKSAGLAPFKILST